jgi:ketosteroid isomerase-like protein
LEELLLNLHNKIGILLKFGINTGVVSNFKTIFKSLNLIDMKYLIIVVTALFVLNINHVFAQKSTQNTEEVDKILNDWHKAAAEANFKAYFDLMTEDAIFIGTDATENWNRKAFEDFSKPYFDKGKAWSFTAIERHVFFDSTGNLAWFDELLSTHMKICRGSGVMVKIGSEWKIKHYVLSITIPNENIDEVIKIKAPIEDSIIQQFPNKS